MRITGDITSPYSHNIQEPISTEKLVPNLRPKKNYIVHHRNLDYYLRKGLKVTAVHKVLKFREAQWMKPYIMFNTEMRTKATTKFEKDLFKLLNNAVFGKTMENVRKYVNIELVTNEKRFLKLVGNPRYREARAFNESLVAVWLTRPSQQLCKPIYVGFSVLELSKLAMYEFHYDEMKRRYDDRARLLFTDTDSLAYEIRTEDWYKDMAEMLPLLDTSNYPDDSRQLYCGDNKMVIGKMKDETAGQPIQELVGLRSKMYSIKVGGAEKKTAKGVTKDVVRHHLTHNDYLAVLQGAATRRDQMRMIRNHEHNMYSVVVNKTTLSAYDDKRYILDGGNHTLAYGHWRISRMVISQDVWPRINEARRKVTRKKRQVEYFCKCEENNPCPQGPPGPKGADGTDGFQGERGSDGAPGREGNEPPVALSPLGECRICPDGPRGQPGPPGPSGAPGPRGANGVNGKDAMPGPDGPPGEPGINGNPGRPGQPGEKGYPGRPGTRGTRGTPGPKGPPGQPGNPGSPGPNGVLGNPGKRGPSGLPGKKGPAGQTGQPGGSGAPGYPGDPGKDAQYCPCPRRSLAKIAKQARNKARLTVQLR